MKSNNTQKKESYTHTGEYVNHVINPLLFSSKASGTNEQRRHRGQEPPQPIQIINPVGNFGIALPLFNKRNNQDDSDRFNMNTIVISGPEDEEIDRRKISGLVALFAVLGVLNIVFTCLLFHYPNSVDLSKVLPATSLNANRLAFVEISEDRTGAESAMFYCTIVNICIGIVSALFKQPLGLASFSLTATLIFFLGFMTIPYFFYITRYTMDAFLVYVGLVLNSRLTVNYLKIHG